LLLSVPLMLEYEAVLTRPQHLTACGLSSDAVGHVLDDLAAVATPVRLAFRWRPRLADPDDDMVLETAINGRASAIVTFNQRDFADAGKDFDCAVILPAAALQGIRSLNPMRRSNFALRLQPSLLEELRKAAELEGVALNQLINVAVAEKVSAMRTQEYFQERARRADRAETLRILQRAGKGSAPVKSDELPSEWPKKPGRQAANGRDSVSRPGQKRRSAK
jgi:predicted nucleic acid-binding protein